MHRINRVEALPGARIRLEYQTGEAMDIDISPMVQRGGVFSQLADPAVFAQVRVGEGGRYVEWPGEIDLCADALFLEGSRLAAT